jgi:hypothetical protein
MAANKRMIPALAELTVKCETITEQIKKILEN